MLGNIITQDMMLNVINSEYVLTRDSIVSSLNDRIASINSDIIFFLILFLFIIIVSYIARKRIGSIITVIALLFIIIFLGKTIYDCICERNSIKYSIENNCWSIENDIVFNKKVKRRKHHVQYYVNLYKYGNVVVSNFMYQNIEEDEKVYVICVQDRSGEKYPMIYEVWPADDTVFIESLPYKK